MEDQTPQKGNLRVRYLVWTTIILVMVLVLSLLIPTITNAIELPFSEIVTALFIVIGAYVGIDQLAAVVRSSREAVGNPYNENKDKLYRICLAMLLLLLECHIIQLLTTTELPLKDLWIGYGIILAEFVAGQKGKLAANGIQNSSPVGSASSGQPNQAQT